MPLSCNIDRKGRRARAISGAVCMAVALGGFLAGWWTVATLLLIVGLFQLFEAAKGWCVMRAMGFKTPW